MADLDELIKGLSEDDKGKLIGMLTGAKPKVPNEGEQGASSANQHDVPKIPRLPKFSGDSRSKAEPSFRVWLFEIENLRTTYKEAEVRQAIHNSVTGFASEVLMRLGKHASLQEILTKFDNIFGTVVNKQKLLADFYTANQKPNESIAEWSCRLEDYLSHPKLSDMQNDSDMLKARFFNGLASESIQNAIRHRQSTSTFNQLVVLAREAEDEMASKPKAVSKPQVADPTLKLLEEISRDVKDFKSKSEDWEKRLERVESQMKSQRNFTKQSTLHLQASNSNDSPQAKQQFTCFFCKSPGHVKRNCQKWLNTKGSTAKGSE